MKSLTLALPLISKVQSKLMLEPLKKEWNISNKQKSHSSKNHQCKKMMQLQHPPPGPNWLMLNLVLLILPLFCGNKVSNFLFSWGNGQSHFLTSIINSFIKKGFSKVPWCHYERDLARRQGFDLTGMFSCCQSSCVSSDQCLCWRLWLSNGAYPDIFHRLSRSHTQT